MRDLQLVIKRIMDIFISSFALAVLSPVIAILAILILLKLGRPIFFTQDRPGKDGKIFRMIKFRTMLNSVDSEGNLLPNEQRHTNFGKLLRITSLDELPELINVLKGDMSVVGPRPLLVEYLPLYNNVQARRHEVRPGITGLAQVSGRNTISWEERFNLDVWYVDNLSLYLDLKILFKTVYKVLKKEGVNYSSSVTMTKFTGSRGISL